jgi:hypothetical protein
MMQRWWIVMLVGLTLVCCQLDRTEPASEVGQDIIRQDDSGDACKAVLPPPVIFDGKPPPIAEPGQVWVFLPPDKNGDTSAALVTADAAKIPYLAIIPKGKLGSFFDDLGNAAQAVFPGHPNPPPPVIDPDLLVFYARRTLDAIALAEQDVKTCSL